MTQAHCPGSDNPVREITEQGNPVTSDGKLKGRRPKGLCPECGQEYSLARKNNIWVMRTHRILSEAPAQVIKISAENLKYLIDKSKQYDLTKEEYLDLILNELQSRDHMV